MLDDLRMELGTYGYPVVQTPNIDALGSSGAVFENSFVSMALCAPSRTAMLTSLRPDTTGVYDLDKTIDQAVPGGVTLADLFRRAGYTTIVAGKFYHHAWLVDDADGYTLRLPMHAEAYPGGSPTALSTFRFADGSNLRDTRDIDDVVTQIGKLAVSGEEFFMGVGIDRPHLPFFAPASDWDRYTAASVPGPVNPSGQVGTPAWAMSSAEVWDYSDLAGYKPVIPEQKATELRWGYMATVSYADGLIGKVVKALRDNHLENNTIVVVWGDNGYKLGDYGAWSKHTNVDLDIKVPLVVSAPTLIPGGQRIKGIVESVDIYPTLADLAGIPYGPQVEGTSFAPLFTDPSLPWKDAAFAQYPRKAVVTKGAGDLMGYTVRTRNYRYTAWVNATGGVVARELFDLVSDPTEAVNVASNSSYAQVMSQLESMRTSGWRSVKSKLLG